MRAFFALFLIFYCTAAKAEEKQNNTTLFIIDFPINPEVQTVHLERLGDGNVNLGSVVKPWKSTLRYKQPLIPEVSLLAEDFQFNFRGAYSNELRETKSLEGHLEVSVWKFLVGVDGFAEQEFTADALQGVRFDADFLRRSFGAKSWLGVTFGGYSKSYVSVKLGRGNAFMEGSRTFKSDALGSFGELPLYSERLNVDSLAIESRIATKFVAVFLKSEKNFYKMRLNSPDPLWYGKNSFDELTFRAAIEIIPISKFDFIRFVIAGQKNFSDQDSLMFKNDPPPFQGYLRIAF